MTTIDSNRVVWIGVVHVRGGAENDEQLGAGRAAYAATVALASSAVEFRESVREYMSKLGLLVLEIEDDEPLESRRTTSTPSSALLMLSKELTDDEPVAVECFDVYLEQ